MVSRLEFLSRYVRRLAGCFSYYSDLALLGGSYDDSTWAVEKVRTALATSSAFLTTARDGVSNMVNTDDDP